jgi:hypothetical protein
VELQCRRQSGAKFPGFSALRAPSRIVTDLHLSLKIIQIPHSVKKILQCVALMHSFGFEG